MAALPEKYGKQFKKDSVIFTANDESSNMYIIQNGKVKISIRAKNAEQVLAVLNKGEFFGEIALFTSRPRTATATVLEDSQLLVINRNSMETLLENNNSFTMNIIQKLCRRIQQANLKIEELLVISKDTRLLRELALYWNSAGEKQGDTLVVDKKGFESHIQNLKGFSKEDIAIILKRLISLGQIAESEDKTKLIFSAKIFYNNEFRSV